MRMKAEQCKRGGREGEGEEKEKEVVETGCAKLLRQTSNTFATLLRITSKEIELESPGKSKELQNLTNKDVLDTLF